MISHEAWNESQLIYENEKWVRTYARQNDPWDSATDNLLQIVEIKLNCSFLLFLHSRAVTDPRDGRRVALKKLPNVFQSLVSSKRVFRELKMLCFFKHENVSFSVLFCWFVLWCNAMRIITAHEHHTCNENTIYRSRLIGN
jgi:hypothetical protein